MNLFLNCRTWNVILECNSSRMKFLSITLGHITWPLLPRSDQVLARIKLSTDGTILQSETKRQRLKRTIALHCIEKFQFLWAACNH